MTELQAYKSLVPKIFNSISPHPLKVHTVFTLTRKSRQILNLINVTINQNWILLPCYVRTTNKNSLTLLSHACRGVDKWERIWVHTNAHRIMSVKNKGYQSGCWTHFLTHRSAGQFFHGIDQSGDLCIKHKPQNHSFGTVEKQSSRTSSYTCVPYPGIL